MNPKNAFSFHHISTCESTQEKALELAHESSVVPHVVLADKQTRGRGRRGNVWRSKPGSSLTMSLSLSLLNTPVHPQVFQTIPLVAGVALWAALGRINKKYLTLQFKWPNDLGIYNAHSFQKTAGVLVEVKKQSLVIGWGVNLAGIPHPGALSLTDVAFFNSQDRPRLSKEIASLFLEGLSEAGEDPASYIDRLLEFVSNQGMFAMVGKNVVAAWGEGKVVGLGALGSLLVQGTGPLREITSGEVNL